MTDIFISYSRKNSAFVRQLYNALEKEGIKVWVDWKDIPPTREWWDEITKGIDEAHTFLFVISPSSVTSPICHLEIAHASFRNKRLIPIVHIPVDEEKFYPELIRKTLDENTRQRLGDRKFMAVAQENWQEISRHNWLFFGEEAPFSESVGTLISAMKTDFDHIREHTKWLIRARSWEAQEKKPDFLLDGVELQQAQQWLEEAADKDPPPAELHHEYLKASQQLHLRI